MHRRYWLRLGGATCAATALPFLFRRSVGNTKPSLALVSDPAGRLDLAPGLNYRVLERVYDPMSDGYRVPARPDGMACFPGPDKSWVLMRNHELDYNQSLGASRQGSIKEAYNPSAAGGVTRLLVNPETGERISSNLVLAGTLRNCAGGPSPWGWISCEETFEPGHGYAFLCRTDQGRVSSAKRLAGYGRFRHEAAAVDPKTHIAYLSEDEPDACLYRFVPTERARPFAGKLQALRHTDIAGYALSSRLGPLEQVPVSWVDIPDPEAKHEPVRYQAAALGAATIRRGEGLWFDGGKLFVCSTDGGKARRGQIFVLKIGIRPEPDRLSLLAESPGQDSLDMPDNITVAPWGDVIVAEDGWGEQHLRGITPEGSIYDIARNALSRGEFAGVCFSPDGSTLFANLQLDGLTVAITGTFPRYNA